MYLNQRKQSPKCNIINKIISFIDSPFFSEFGSTDSRQTTYISLICLVTYNCFGANWVSNMIRYPHTKNKEILIINIIYPHTILNKISNQSIGDHSTPFPAHPCPYLMNPYLLVHYSVLIRRFMGSNPSTSSDKNM